MADFARFAWLNLTADGDICPCRVVVGISGATKFKRAVEGTDNTVPCLALVTENVRFPPGSASDDGLNAKADEGINVVSPGEFGNAIAGAAITNGSLPLTFDSQGRVVSVTAGLTTRQWCIGWPTHGVTAAGQKVEVAVVTPFCYLGAIS